jgi:hypothetical protein
VKQYNFILNLFEKEGKNNLEGSHKGKQHTFSFGFLQNLFDLKKNYG